MSVVERRKDRQQNKKHRCREVRSDNVHHVRQTVGKACELGSLTISYQKVTSHGSMLRKEQPCVRLEAKGSGTTTMGVVVTMQHTDGLHKSLVFMAIMLLADGVMSVF